MHASKLFAAAAAAIFLGSGPLCAQADAGAQSGAAAAAPGATAKTGKPARKKRGKKTRTPPAAAPDATLAPPPSTTEVKPPAQPVAPAAPPAATSELAAPAGPEDNDPPSLQHTPVTKSLKGKPLQITARITDPSGVFQPVVYLRKKGMGTADYIPIKMVGSKVAQGDYAAEVPPALTTVDLEYYIEAYDSVGNGPSRAGSPENPLPIKLEEEKKTVIVKPTEPPPTNVIVAPQHKGAPPAISHTAVTRATKSMPVEINARLVGDTGVQGATVMFRHTGEKEYKALPMGNIGGDDWTATIPATMVTGDLEYFLEAFDKFGNGPGRSGAPNVPYIIQILEQAPAGPTKVVVGKTTSGQGDQPRLVRAPFKPNPGRAAGWLFMAGFVGATIFTGGEALGAWQANNAYRHTYEYEGRLVPELRDRANAYSHRTKVAGIVAISALAVGVTLLFLFPEHPDTMLVGGSGGDAPVLVRF